MLPKFDLNNCPRCQEDIDEFIDSLQDNYPVENENDPIPQEASALAGIAVYCLGQLHERDHPMDLMEYGRSLHIPGSQVQPFP